MKMKKLASAMALGLGLSLAAGPSVGAIQAWGFQDDDIDFLLDENFDLVDPATAGTQTIEVGDTLVSVFEMPTFTIDGDNAIPDGHEVTGVAAITLVTKDGDGAGTEDPWVFTAATGGLDAVLVAILGVGGDAVLDGEGGEGSVLAMFINDATAAAGLDRDLSLDAIADTTSNCTSLLDCVTEATQDDLLQIDGFLGDPDEFWLADVAAGGDDIDSVLALGVGTTVASANFALSNFFNTSEPVLFQTLTSVICDGAALGDADGCTQVVGFSTIVGGSFGGDTLTNGAFAHSDANAIKFVEVPEPASLALLGVGLLGFGAGLRKRKA